MRKSRTFAETLSVVFQGSYHPLSDMCFFVIACLDIAAYFNLLSFTKVEKANLFDLSHISDYQVSRMKLSYAKSSFIPNLYSICRAFVNKKEKPINK